MVVKDFPKNLNNSQRQDTILPDFSKAFDKVNYRNGIRGKLFDWISERTQYVVWGKVTA